MMDDLRTQPGSSDTARGCASPALAREDKRNRLCEVRQNPAFGEWWRLTLALGPEECLLLLASEIASAAPTADTAALARTLASLARTLNSAVEGEDRWVNPLFPLPQPEAPLEPPLPLTARLDAIAASAD